MMKKLIFTALFCATMTTEAHAIGWNCSNRWGGNYKFTADGGNSGTVQYEGPLDSTDVATGARHHRWGNWWHLQIGKHFEFSVPGFGYNCFSYDNGVKYWCEGTQGNPGIELVNCYGRPI